MVVARAVLISTCLFICLSASFAIAQEAPPPVRPVRALFQGEREDRESRQSLIFSGSLFGTHDGNIVAGRETSSFDASSLIDGRSRKSGFYSQGGAELFYGRRNSRVKFATNAGADLNYYPDLRALTQSSYHGSADVLFLLRRTTIWARQGLSSTPYLVFSAFPVLPDPNGTVPLTVAGSPDLGVSSQSITTYSTSARLNQTVARHSSLEITYEFRSANSTAGLADFASQSGATRLNHQVGRHTVVHAGYSYGVTDYKSASSPNSKIHNHDLDVGLEYARPLSPTRRMRFGLGSGSSMMDRKGVSVSEDDKTYYQILGYSSLSYDVSRTWSAGAEFRRALQLIPGLSEPFFANGVTVSLGGQLSRRVDILGNARYSQGEVGVQAVAKGYDARAVSVRLRYGLSRELALSTEYVNYDYQFSQAAQLPPGVSRALTRHVIRLGLTFGSSLLHQQRKP